MTVPRILERDTKIVEWNTQLESWSTNEKNPYNGTIDMVSDGLLHADHATMSIFDAVAAITALKCSGVGINMKGPEPGDDYTPYQISVVAHTADPVLIPLLFVGESIASITSGTAGDAITDVRIIGWGQISGTEASNIEKDITIVCPENTAGRGLAIGIAMYAPNTGGGTEQCQVDMSIRRLHGVSPPILDTRKL